MKHWKVSYSIKYEAVIAEATATIEAESITSAAYKAFVNIVEPTQKFPDVNAVVITSIEMIDKAVF